MYVGVPNGTPIVIDSGPAGGGGPGVGMSEGLWVAPGSINIPNAGSGTGAYGSNLCDYDAPATSAGGYHYLCLSADANGGGLIAYGAAGGASVLPLNFVVNGVTFNLGGISAITIGTTTISGGSNNAVLYDNAGIFGAITSANNSVLVTNGSGVPSFSTTLPASINGNGLTGAAAGSLSGSTLAAGVTASSLTSVGVIATGVWNGTAIGQAYGGTGISTAATAGQLLVGQVSGAYALESMSADATLGASGALTLATVNSNTGSFGTASAIPAITVNGKGLITAVSTNAVTAPAGTVTGTTLASNVVTSSLTTVGTIGTGTWQGTTVAVGFGGTGDTTFTANTPLIGNGGSAIAQGTRSGNTTKFATSTGTLTPGDCVQIDANGNYIDAGGACTTGGGGGTVSAGSTNQLAYYGSNGTVVTGLGTANSGVLVTSGAGVPSISTTLPAGITGNGITGAAAGSLSGATLAAGVTASSLTSLGTIATGVWNGTVVGATYGGTGVNNGSNTLTLGAALTTTGGVTTLALGAGGRTYTFPDAAGTVDLIASAQTLSSKTLASPIVTGAFTATGLVTNADLVNTAITINSTPCTLGSSCSVTATAASITVGTTSILSGTSGDIEYNNGGTLGELAVIGSSNGGTGVNNGSSTITLGANLTTTGAGAATLAFPGSSATYTFPTASATLPAYVAGSWTPGISATGTTGSVSYNTQQGSYEQIGRQVTVRFVVTVGGWTGSPTGQVLITGLPVASSGSYGECSFSYWDTQNINVATITGLIATGGSSIYVYYITGSGGQEPVALTPANAGAPQFYGMCNYHT